MVANAIPIKDNTGREFKSIRELCFYHKIGYDGFLFRMRTHPEETIEYWMYGSKFKSFYKDMAIVDYNGKEFGTEKLMCDYHGVNYETYRQRKKRYPNSTVKYYLTGNKKYK